MEPWFLYGIELTPERRQEILKLHGERRPDGKPANPGWPNYVKGVLTPEDQGVLHRPVLLVGFRLEESEGKRRQFMGA